MKKTFDSEPVCNEKYLKTKSKSYEGKISTNFHCDKLPKEGSQCIFLSVILVDYVFRRGKSYCCQMFLKECTCTVKKMPKYITENTDKENYCGRNSDEKNSSEE